MRALSLLVAFVAAASGQTGPEILNKVAATYQSLKSYHFEAQVVSETVSDSNESRSRSTRISAANLPDRRRLETKGGQMAGVRIWDGKTVWDYRPGPNQFARQDQAAYKPPRMNTLSDPVDTYKALDKAASAKLLREETLTVTGAPHSTWVVEVPPRFPAGGIVLERSPATYWIDQSTNVILKESESVKMKTPMMDAPQLQTTTITYVVARINEPAPGDLFRFQPPANASEVGEFTSPFGGASTMTGKPAPSFTLQDLEAHDVTLDSLKGKPVLLSFWATWCGPCREQMPKIQETQRLFADQGLVVLAINSGESPDVAKKYIDEHHYTFRVLLDQGKTMGGRYSVSSIPALFLIDRDGNIRAHFVGFNTALDLGEELKKLGL